MRISAKTILLTLVALLLTGALAGAQTMKDITVGYNSPYTDHITLAQDSRDKDIMVKFSYNQAEGTLTVSAISYRKLFVFRDRTRYGSIVNFFGRIIPEKFPYVISSEQGEKYRFSGELKRSISGCRSKHVFGNWLEYTGMKPQPTEYRMDNDYVEQVFDILQDAPELSVTLRDIFLLENGKILCGKDLQIRYNISLKRNPCMGRDKEIAEAGTTLDNLIQNYNALKATSGDGKADSQESADLFSSLKEAVVAQFPRREEPTECEAEQSLWDAYNDIVDSLAALKCEFIPRKTGVEVQVIQMNARELDENVSRWLLSTDPVERRDLAEHNEEIIKDLEELVRVSGLVGDDQQEAYSTFLKAARYSRKIIK